MFSLNHSLKLRRRFSLVLGLKVARFGPKSGSNCREKG